MHGYPVSVFLVFVHVKKTVIIVQVKVKNMTPMQERERYGFKSHLGFR